MARMGWNGEGMEASPLSNLATDRRKGSTRRRGRGTLAVWQPGTWMYCAVSLVRVRMHHGPMGRSMDDGVGLGGWWWVDGRMDGQDG